jgi:hypothetical protein
MRIPYACHDLRNVAADSLVNDSLVNFIKPCGRVCYTRRLMENTSKSIITGFLRVFDLTAKIGVEMPKVRIVRDDAEAVQSDWKAVGDSFRSASQIYEKKKKAQLRTGT